MSDDLHIPAHAGAFGAGRAPISSAYRPRPVREPGMRGAIIAAAALGAVLLAGFGTWAVMNRRPAAPPVIEADSRPLRVRPENPGGMQVAGAEEQVLGGTGSGADRMAPPPEVPAPLALRAQMQPASPLSPAPSPAPSPAAQPAPIPGATAAALPDTPPRPAAATARPAPPQAARPAAGAMQVQLAALESEAAAQSEWQRLARRMPDLLGDRRPVLQRAERDGRPVWRVRTGGFADIAEATAFCAKVKAKSAACTLASF